MDVVSDCPLRVTSLVWQTITGSYVLTIVCKATYGLRPVESKLTKEQEAPNQTDRYWNDDETCGLHAPSDLAPYKTRADVIVVGNAFAPQGLHVRSMVARLCVGEVDKAIEVLCDRRFATDGRLLEGPRFSAMPLGWERTAGGPGTSNPIGMRFDAQPDLYGTVAIPNLQPRGHQVVQRSDAFLPIGFGPIAPHWPGRFEKLFHHAGSWSHSRWFERPMPSDIDPTYFNAAPMDQQVQSIRPSDRLVLEGLHRDHPRLVTSLQSIQPRAEAEGPERGREEIALICDTLWIDTDRALCTTVWRGRIGLRHPREAGHVRVTLETAGDVLEGRSRRHRASAVPVRPGDSSDRVRNLETSPVQIENAPGAPLPFVPGSAGAIAFAQPLIKKHPSPPSFTVDTRTITEPVTTPTRDVLPFQAVGSSGVPPVLAVNNADAQAEAPPMIGPLATPEMAARAARAPKPAALERPAVTVGSAPPPRDARAAAAEFPLERCAAMTASIARRRAELGRILDENGLTKEAWTAIEKHWAEKIRNEMSRSRTELLNRFDAAYVEQLEKERGQIQVSEYARLAVAMERGTVVEELIVLSLPKGSVMRIERVWVRRMARDMALRERVEAGIEAERRS